MKTILILLFLFLSSCQTVNFKEYTEDGKLIKEYSRTGTPNWSDNKTIPVSFSGIGV